MKSIFYFFGLITLTAALIFTSCDNGDSGNGIDVNDPNTLSGQLNVSSILEAPLNRRAPQLGLTTNDFFGTIQWRRVVGTHEINIGPKEVFSSDNGARIKAVITLIARGSNKFGNLVFVHSDADSVKYTRNNATSAVVEFTFPAIPEPSIVTRWFRAADADELPAIPHENNMFWATFYDDDTFLIFNSHDGKGGKAEAVQGYYILSAGTSGNGGPTDLTSIYDMYLTWVDAYAAIAPENTNRANISQAELLAWTFVGDEVGVPRDGYPVTDDGIEGNDHIIGRVVTGTTGVSTRRLAITPRWHDVPGMDPFPRDVRYHLYATP